MKKIVIAEDHENFREVLRDLLSNFEIVGEAEDGEQAIQLVHQTRPDLLILDLSMPRVSGINVIRELKRQYPRLKILVLTIHDAEPYVRGCCKEGIEGYFLKDESRDALSKAIDIIMAGGRYISPAVSCGVGTG